MSSYCVGDVRVLCECSGEVDVIVVGEFNALCEGYMELLW